LEISKIIFIFIKQYPEKGQKATKSGYFSCFPHFLPSSTFNHTTNLLSIIYKLLSILFGVPIINLITFIINHYFFALPKKVIKNASLKRTLLK